jgi:3-deoxy-D-manno-octulosonic-acid transferase
LYFHVFSEKKKKKRKEEQEEEEEEVEKKKKKKKKKKKEFLESTLKGDQTWVTKTNWYAVETPNCVIFAPGHLSRGANIQHDLATQRSTRWTRGLMWSFYR